MAISSNRNSCEVLRSEDWNVWRHGPINIVEGYEGEYYSTFQVCYNQANKASCLMTFWDVDGETTYYRLTGTNHDWSKFWTAWLELLPSDLAKILNQIEPDLRY